MPAYRNARKQPKTLTLRRLRGLHLRHFLDQVHRGMRSRATYEMHVCTWAFVLEYFGAGADARRITRARLIRWVAQERRGRLKRADGSPRQLSPASIRLRVCTLRGAMKVARKEGLIERLPEFPETSFRYESRTAWLDTFADYERLLAQLPAERRPYFALLIWTWQHPSDVERMTHADLEIHENPPWVIVRNTKNRRPPIKVVAPAELVRVFREKFMFDGTDLGDRLVKPWPARVRTLPAICQRLGLPRITATAARHTGISWAIRHLGITPAVMAWSGHRSPKMIATVYGHAMPAQLAEVAGALDSMRGPAQKSLHFPAALSAPGGSARKESGPVSVISSDRAGKPSQEGETLGSTPTLPTYRPSEFEERLVPRDRIELSTQGFSTNPGVAGSTVSELLGGPSSSRTLRRLNSRRGAREVARLPRPTGA
jgi:integrase